MIRGYLSSDVEKEKAPERVGHGLARHPVPIILLARLAVDRSEKGKGLGSGLLRDALLRVISAAEIVGGRALLVHAKDEKAKAFYEHFGFDSSPIDPFHLFLLMKDIRRPQIQKKRSDFFCCVSKDCLCVFYYMEGFIDVALLYFFFNYVQC